LLQTPASTSRATDAAQLRKASKTPTREREPGTAKAVLRDIPMSAKKLAKWTDVVRRKHIDDALVQCDMAHKKAAQICAKVRRLTP
jgi:ribosomal protein L22